MVPIPIMILMENRRKIGDLRLIYCESCGDKNGDGCSTSCLIEPKFECAGNMREVSKCKESTDPVCGNKVFEPPKEQCDNGKQAGCKIGLSYARR